MIYLINLKLINYLKGNSTLVINDVQWKLINIITRIIYKQRCKLQMLGFRHL